MNWLAKWKNGQTGTLLEMDAKKQFASIWAQKTAARNLGAPRPAHNLYLLRALFTKTLLASYANLALRLQTLPSGALIINYMAQLFSLPPPPCRPTRTWRWKRTTTSVYGNLEMVVLSGLFAWLRVARARAEPKKRSPDDIV